MRRVLPALAAILTAAVLLGPSLAHIHSDGTATIEGTTVTEGAPPPATTSGPRSGNGTENVGELLVDSAAVVIETLGERLGGGPCYHRGPS